MKTIHASRGIKISRCLVNGKILYIVSHQAGKYETNNPTSAKEKFNCLINGETVK
jgi:hypothetical protein